MINRIAIYFDAFIPSSKKSFGLLNKIIGLLHKVSLVRSTPRNFEYMRNLVKNKISENIIIYTLKTLKDIPDIQKAEEIVLLWSDPIGRRGWRFIEKHLLKIKNKNQKIFVLNGRQRYFEYTANAARQINLRRFIDKFLVGEIAFSLIFMILSPLFLFIDILRKRI